MKDTTPVKSILKGIDSYRRGRVSRELATKLMCRQDLTSLIKQLG